MKKIACIFVAVVTLLCFLSCNQSNSYVQETHIHIYNPATCKSPKMCSICGHSEGEPSLTHSYDVKNKCVECGLIQLTKYNFEDYLEAHAYVSGGNYTGALGYSSLKCEFKVEGNTHFKYNDVEIVVKFTHFDSKNYLLYLSNALKDINGEPIEQEAVPSDEETCTVKLNLAGNGDVSCTLYPDDWNKNLALLQNSTIFSIISVSGTVQEY